jgi:hypothetical protein
MNVLQQAAALLAVLMFRGPQTAGDIASTVSACIASPTFRELKLSSTNSRASRRRARHGASTPARRAQEPLGAKRGPQPRYHSPSRAEGLIYEKKTASTINNSPKKPCPMAAGKTFV